MIQNREEWRNYGQSNNNIRVTKKIYKIIMWKKNKKKLNEEILWKNNK